MALPPSKVRRRILDEHTRISGWLAELEHLSRRLRSGEDGVSADLSRRAFEFERFFSSHLALEESILAPALERAGGPGPSLAKRLVDEHASQRLMLREFAREVGAPDATPGGLADQVDLFVRAVRLDMAAEESLELDAELLTDPS